MNRQPHSLPTRLLLRLTRLEKSSLLGAQAQPPAKEFHVSLASRSLLQLNHALFSITGNVILADFQAVRIFTQKLNAKRDTAKFPEKAVQPGSVNAMGLIDEILHYVVSLYAAQVKPLAFNMLLDDLEKSLGGSAVRKALVRFCKDFPPQPVYDGHAGVEEYLLGTSSGAANRVTVLEEMLLLWLANVNPAFAPFRELFDDSSLDKETEYRRLMTEVEHFFAGLPPFGPDGQSLVDMLRSPARAFPDSLPGQLQYIREKWGLLLGKYLDRLLSGLDLIKEDEKRYFPGPGPAVVFDAAAAAEAASNAADESERFSQDREWMPRLVLMAKTAYVWLDQLSKKYGRPITTLDQVPDGELDLLAGWGFTGLWLIGIWERSPASRRIKQKCGNPEALASAYSLYRYEIAADLGGENALQNLKARAWSRGIRLASDMVPNHMGIDSPWVVEHPEWFIALDHSPFPAYTFSGEDMSGDPRVGIYIEDHYYDRSDAAVVFKWVDRRSGTVRYIYHGNDGTRMPWNDTAQLNYLRADVREAVARTILEVARNFPIIRFDAAMTLTRRHYQRLWYPSPGTGGDIPSRAGQGLSQQDFDRAMPSEFWRDIVERTARETPDTLLLAEAFWMMESFFVRSLGMHRVYNSAFMNFLKMEENAKFRLSLKNVLEFNPEILKRYVNFMNNPDEETAVAQFGSGDKYFGVCTLMAALPGLPMVGHGQIEGFREKYGMEYRKAYLDERADDELVGRHERQIFPLLRRRALFSGVKDFLLYDFFLSSGAVDENVIAFSNRHEGERCLVVVHNRFADTAGWVRVSAAYAGEERAGGPRSLQRQDLGQGLGLRNEPGWFVVFRDAVSGLEYIRPASELCANGMFIELHAYQTHVFLDFREMADDAGAHLARLSAYLQGRGVGSMEEAGREMSLQPLHNAWRELCRTDLLQRQLAVLHDRTGSKGEGALWLELEEKIGDLFCRAGGNALATGGSQKIIELLLEDLLVLWTVLCPERGHAQMGADGMPTAKNILQMQFKAKAELERLFLLWLYAQRLTETGSERRAEGRSLFAEWLLDGVLVESLRGWGFSESRVDPALRMIRSACGLRTEIRACSTELAKTGGSVAAALGQLVKTMARDDDVQALLQLHRFQNDLFFNRENFHWFCDWLAVQILWEFHRSAKKEAEDRRQPIAEIMEFFNFLPALAAKTGFKLEIFLEKLDQLAAGKE